MENQTYLAAGNIIALQPKPTSKPSSKQNPKPNAQEIDRESDSGPAVAAAGSKNDPRMKEALTLMEAFLAIEDQVARTALVTLAQQLVSHDWARRVRRL